MFSLIAGFGTGELALLAALGVAAGMIGGLLGIGGGLVMIPAMLFALGETRFGANSLHSYKLASLCVAALGSIPATRQHLRAGAVSVPLLRVIVPAALAAALVGAAVSSWFAGERAELLRRVFGGVMILTVVIDLAATRLRGSVQRDRCPTARCWGRYALAVGAPAGIMSGLLGIGGGLWAVPTQQLGFGLRLQSAIANSAVLIGFSAGMAAISQAVVVAGLPDQRVATGLLLAGLLLPGALLGASLGAFLTHRLPVRALRLAFHGLLLISGGRLALGG